MNQSQGFIERIVSRANEEIANEQPEEKNDFFNSNKPEEMDDETPAFIRKRLNNNED